MIGFYFRFYEMAERLRVYWGEIRENPNKPKESDNTMHRKLLAPSII